MHLFLCAGILILTILAYYILGRAFCIRCGCRPVIPETVCLGFFLYYAVFQALAVPMILTKQKLHILGITWAAVLAVLLAGAVYLILQENKRSRPAYDSGARQKYGKINHAMQAGRSRKQEERRIRDAGLWLLTALMGCAIFCECASAVLMQRNIGWDFAYYIGNMATSVATDTMYVYDGSSGLLRNTMELRYALSSFYMNTACISQATGISALVLQKYVYGILCVLLTNAIVYSFAMKVFRGDCKKTAVLVTITIVMTIFWDVYDTSGQFLLLRNYEAKAYCANVVVPMTGYLLYRLWTGIGEKSSWAGLFLTAFASVAVSMSSLVIVPVMIVIMLLAHMAVEKQLDFAVIRRGCFCLLPNVCYMAVFLCYTKGWLVIRI
ncbi:MAG: hypothetical protein HFH32_10930 [Eubacterium sp.]|jgi:hypothetical protein|nr:hypothetical protein [Eubacterium sp.]